MAFLRISRGVVRGKHLVRETVVYNGRKFTVENYKRCNGKLVSRKRAAEYLWRLETNTLACSDGGGKCGLAFMPEFDTPLPLVEPVPRKFTPAPSGVMRRVYRHGLLWRVTVENIWQSDHATMEDALSGTNAIGVEPGKIKAGVVIVPQ